MCPATENIKTTERFRGRNLHDDIFSTSTLEASKWKSWFIKARAIVIFEAVAPHDLRPFYSEQTPIHLPTTRFLSKLNYDKYQLNINGLFLQVDFTFEASRVIAYNEKFGIYGSGDTEDSAMDDFEQSFIEFYLMLTDCPEDNLGKSSIAFRKLLENFATLTINE